MKKPILLLLIVPFLGFGQGEQRYADGTATDQDGNTFEWINYGTQDWAIENAEVVTYRDGTTIPQVTDATDWQNLTTGAWCYYDNDPSKGKLYNWYAVAGIHDNDENTPNKEFAPEGWHVPTENEWTSLNNYLIVNSYSFYGNTGSGAIAKAMSSTNGWFNSTSSTEAAVGNNQTLNNKSGFNAISVGSRNVAAGYYGSFEDEGKIAIYWEYNNSFSESTFFRLLDYNYSYLLRNIYPKKSGFSVRFVRDASTASTNEYSNAIIVYPNPTSSLLALNSDKEYDIEVYDMAGNKVMETQGNFVNMEHLSSATYIVKATDKSNNEELTYKVVKN